MYINDSYIDDDAALALSKAAIIAGRERGYCSEVERIIEDLGLPLPKVTKKVTIEVEVEVQDDETNLTDEYYWNITHDLTTVLRGNFTVESVTTVTA